jgi:hypothetical protein
MLDNPWAGRPGTITGPPIESAANEAPVAPRVPPSAGGHGGVEVSGGGPSAPSPETEARLEAGKTAPAVGDFAKFTEFSRPITDRFRADLHDAPPELMAHAQTWLYDATRGAIDLDNVKRAHSYNFDLSTIRTVRGRAEVTSFLNLAAANGISEEHALRAVGSWLDITRRGGASALLKKGGPT